MKIFNCFVTTSSFLILIFFSPNLIRLKKEKEEQRKSEEQVSRRLVEPRDPVTGDTSLEALAREIELDRQMRETIRQNEMRLQKVREMERYAKCYTLYQNKAQKMNLFV